MSEQHPEETHEQVYRRAYRDGWIEALNAIGALMFEHGKSRDKAHLMCWKHWEEALSDWQERAEDPQATRKEPPALKLKGQDQ